MFYRRLDVGFVWQATARNLVSYLTVRDNVELPMAIAGAEAGLRRGRSMELLSSLDIEDKAGRLPHQLSGGEQQRVAIAVAMANNPPMLLADEPTGELDTQTANQVLELLRHMNSVYKVTVIIVHPLPRGGPVRGPHTPHTRRPHQLRELPPAHLSERRR